MGPVYGKRPYSNAERPSEGNYTSEPPPTDTLDRSEQCAPLAEGKEKTSNSRATKGRPWNPVPRDPGDRERTPHGRRVK